MDLDIEKLLKDTGILDKPNVIGFSKKLMPKIKEGKATKDKAIRIYVSKKVDTKNLKKNDLIPSCIHVVNAMGVETLQTDIVEIGEVKALVDKTAKFRPIVPLGVSIGHINITAGSLGMYYTKDNQIYMGSNAHVFTPDASLDQNAITEKRILQQGSYHGGTANDVVAEYVWHKKIYPEGVSPCPVGNFVAKSMNVLPTILGRRGRFQYCSIEPNKIDFAVAKPLKDIIPDLNTADNCIPSTYKFIGHLFAGSDQIGIICKVKHIINEGYMPMWDYAEVSEGDRVKGCSFWCHYETTVMDTSAVLTVNYGNFIATFEDVIMVSNDGTIRGGYSGSGWFKVM